MSKRASLVAFIVAVVIQILILVAVPARKVFTRATGKTVRPLQHSEWLLCHPRF